ncbi:MAG: hypothetical protein V3S16_17945 [Candidatus Desulfatibia sp.]|uniref:hypothetical protein n=1 Tax=Candidatus Desulfatibia sp. TaxID=3101189 RepID=UPI002F3343D1
MRRLEFFESNLISNLFKIGYPLKREDVIALDKIGSRFDSKNRIKLFEKILLDRDFIHSRKDIDYFIRTEVILDALRLLDEHFLPIANALIDELSQLEGWERREKALLASMAAKRGIRYRLNAAYLLSVLPPFGSGLERIDNGESFQAIIDVMNYTSYLADLFIYKGDKDILNALIAYISKAYGLPAEHLSQMFGRMLLLRPKVFISTLAAQDEQTVNTVINSLHFGIRNNREREKVKAVLQKNLFTTDKRSQGIIYLIMNKFSTLTDHANKTLPKVPDSHADSGK